MDQQPLLLEGLRVALASTAVVDTSTDFSDARSRLLRRRYHRVIANLRLGDYNGLHLAHLVDARTRCVVYSDRNESFLRAEAQRVGAFYEWYERLVFSLRSYVSHDLPPFDRRGGLADRRQSSRGGRRCCDRIGSEAAGVALALGAAEVL